MEKDGFFIRNSSRYLCFLNHMALGSSCSVKVIPGDLAWLPMYGPALNPNWVYATVVTILGIIMVLRHHENIARIRNGTERKITWMK